MVARVDLRSPARTAFQRFNFDLSEVTVTGWLVAPIHSFMARLWRAKVLTPATKIIRLTLAASFLVAAAAMRAGAQEVNDDDRQSGCGRVASREERACESDDTVGDVPFPLEVSRPTEARLRNAQIRDDLDYLRAAGLYLSDVASRSGGLDFRAIAKKASEVRKRADRLKFGLPGIRRSSKDGEERVPADPKELRASLSALSALIADAVRDPVVKGYTLDAARSSEARKKLDEIVELSGRVKTCGEMQGKNGQ